MQFIHVSALRSDNNLNILLSYIFQGGKPFYCPEAENMKFLYDIIH